MDKLTEMRERHGRQHLPRLFSGEVDEKQSEIGERYLGVGVALGAGFGLAAVMPDKQPTLATSRG